MSKFVAYLPLSRTISNASLLAVPGVFPIEGVTAWAAGETVAIGDKRSYNGNAYMVIAFTDVTTAAKQPVAVDGDDVTDSKVTWRYIRPVRKQLIITNDSTVVIYLAFKTAAVANKGIRLNANGGTFNAISDLHYVPECDIYAIAASAGSHNLCIQES